MFVLGVILFAGWIIYMSRKVKDCDAQAMLSALGAGILMLIGGVSMVVHIVQVGQVAEYEQSSERIAISTEHVWRLRANLESFPFPRGSYMDADTPVAQVAKDLAAAEKELTEEKKRQVELLTSITASLRGLMWPIAYIATPEKYRE